MSLAATRERRSTAGNRLSKILTEEEDDEFFKTKYGGFEEEAEDNDYKQEKEVSDVTDSDISIDEDDQVRSDLDDDEPKKKRQAGTVTKAYKEPRPTKPKPEAAAPKESPKKKTLITRRERDKTLELKSIRRSTAAKSAETRERIKSRIEIEKKKSKSKKPLRKARKMTQEELLQEAKITERENLKSLEKYQKMELEKKKVRFVRKAPVGPFIRYLSTAMPVIPSKKKGETAKESANEKCERTFITFQDERHFKKAFRKSEPRSRMLYCPFTRMPAKYIDPITNIPYSSKQKFLSIREALNHMLESGGDREDPEVARWLEYCMEVKMERAVAAALQHDVIFQ